MVRKQVQDLADLFQEIQVTNQFPKRKTTITGISIDSRTIEPGNIFLAVPGTNVDGHEFIHPAVINGASAIVGSKSAKDYLDLPVPYLEINDSREALAKLAAAWYGFPARKLIVIGVTGTDGKTTTVNLIHQIMLAAELQAGLISTVNAVIGDQTLDTGFHVTTPEALDVQRYLVEMVEAGITHVVLEVTSHGLAQKRVAACEFDMGVFTNITHEHLDFHGDYQGYLNAKAELIRLIADSKQKSAQYKKLAVLNKDDQSYSALKEVAGNADVQMMDYAIKSEANYRAIDIRPKPDSLLFSINRAKDQPDFQTSLKGDYNVSNCLAAAVVCRQGLGLEWEPIREGIKNLSGIPGRMEYIDLGQDFYAIVDFAHTPNALNRALTAARDISSKRVIAVFGSAGLRDREKRRLMAEVSAELADFTVLTAEDPRTESLEGILEEMAEGVISKGGIERQSFWCIPDRGEAIRFALQLADPDDVVMVCGKGHEQSMCFGEVEYPWDDRTATMAALSELLERAGPEMPYLPTQDK